jgi:FtsP/CotA-like multicopper oxidase with cupredoxin domain
LRPHEQALAAPRWLAALPLVPVLLSLQSVAAVAGPCLAPNQKLLPVPEIRSNNGVLRGTILLTSEQRRLIFRAPGTIPGQPGIDCLRQTVRAFIGVEATPKVPPSPGGFIDPYPGPTLRARLGDVVHLTFVNQIDPNRFPLSKDQGQPIAGVGQDPASGCDISNPGSPALGYPYLGGDVFPDCLHGSSTGNIHFHGTHTNPDTTADNVLLEIRPSPRDPKTRAPQITPEAANKSFADFFARCAAELRKDVFSLYPTTWKEVPLGPYTKAGTWTNQQMGLLQAYENQSGQKLWQENARVIAKDKWPQYYIGAYPYCFVIPEYKEPTWPPPPGSKSPIMGQSPGTHWYHAHKHGSTAINVANGMTGVFIIEGDYDDKLNAFYESPDFTRKIPVMVINQLGVSPNLLRQPASQAKQGGPGLGSQDKGPDFSVNGRAQPLVEMAPGEVQMWRIANTSGRSGAYFSGFQRGFQWRQLAQDGVQFTHDNYMNSANKPLLLASGNRADLLVKAPLIAGKYNITVQHEVDPTDLPKANQVTLIQVSVTGQPAKGKLSEFIDRESFPKQPRFLTNITDAEVTGGTGDSGPVGTVANPRVITFASTPPSFTATPTPGQTYAMHTINGLKFDENNPKDVIPLTLGTVEEWKIVNASYGPLISHPFHIHINPFQILEVFSPNEQVVTSKGHTVPKYVFYNDPAPDPAQCYLNPNDPTTWKDCKNVDDPTKPRIWWDVFPIPSGTGATDAKGNPINDASGNQIMVPGFFRMRSRFVDYAGQYVLHCHILAHEDRGMMMMVQVTRPGTTVERTLYKHH